MFNIISNLSSKYLPNSYFFKIFTKDSLKIFNIQRRALYSFPIKPNESPAIRINRYFEKFTTLQEKCRFMSEVYLNELPDFQKFIFTKEFGQPDGSEKYTLQALKRLSDLTKLHQNIHSNDRWTNYRIDDVEALPGCTHRYSSPSAQHVSENLPIVLNNLFGLNYNPSIIEIGGFAFSDSFLIHIEMEKNRMSISEYIGLDINHSARIAAQCFNKYVAKIENFYIRIGDGSELLSKMSSTYKEKEKVLIALRFLAVLNHEQILSFFSSARKIMKNSDLLIFNYSSYDRESEMMCKKSGYSFDVTNGIHVLKKGNEQIQTFFEGSSIEKLIDDHRLKIIYSYSPKLLGTQGNGCSRGQFDKYKRTIITSIKHDPGSASEFNHSSIDKR